MGVIAFVVHQRLYYLLKISNDDAIEIFLLIMPSDTSTKNWLKAKLQYIKKNTSFQFSDDVLISILVCLVAGDKHLILTCKQENIEELRSMTEQVTINISINKFCFY
jgi:hypothetical protein